MSTRTRTTEEEQLHERYTETSRACLDSQREVTNAFVDGLYPAHNDGVLYSSDNFVAHQNEDGSGRIRHYRTTETIRTRSGLIITNSECFSRGWAYCSTPSRRDADLPLNLVRALCNRLPGDYDQYDIISVADNGHHHLVDLGGAQIFVGKDPTHTDRSTWFGFEIPEESQCGSVAEAEELLRPEGVSLDAKRQGEWFFEPMTEGWEPSVPVRKCQDVPNRERNWLHLDRCYDAQPVGDQLPTECRRCGATSFSMESRGPVVSCDDCGHRYQVGDSTYVPPDVQRRYSNAIDGLDSHIPRDLAVAPDGATYVRGTVRHRRNEHEVLNLEERWHRALTHDRDVVTTASGSGRRYD